MGWFCAKIVAVAGHYKAITTSSIPISISVDAVKVTGGRAGKSCLLSENSRPANNKQPGAGRTRTKEVQLEQGGGK